MNAHLQSTIEFCDKTIFELSAYARWATVGKWPGATRSYGPSLGSVFETIARLRVLRASCEEALLNPVTQL